MLALDYEVYEFDDDRCRRWQPRPADETPPPSQARRLGPDGFHYAVRHRIAAVDVAERSMTRELQAWQWQHDELVAHETHTLISNLYSSNEIVTLLGFHVFIATATA